MNEVTREMPRYQCHKKVCALKIKAIDLDIGPRDGWQQKARAEATITPEEEGYAQFKVDALYLRKHQPQAGGYYVVYDDGYKSYSPAEAFESGYTLIP